MNLGIVNYGMGNLASIARMIEDLGARAFIAQSPAALLEADRVILPGVGAFSAAVENLDRQGWRETIIRMATELDRPVLGICLGMQLLADEGEEGGQTRGLGLVPGAVKPLRSMVDASVRVPHVGWNDVAHDGDSLLAGIPSGTDFYFVHSFAFAAANPLNVVATTQYGAEITAVVRHGHVWGAQFHPEKSSQAGRKLLQNFLEYRPC